MLTVNAMGDKCPVPVVKTKKAVESLTADDTVEVLVDNETSVQNVGRFAQSLGFAVQSEKLGEGQYRVCFNAKKGAAEGSAPAESFCSGRRTPSWWSPPTRWAKAAKNWAAFSSSPSSTP